MGEKFIGYLPLSPFDIQLFHQGKNFKSYNFLGARITEYNGIRGVGFALWAPNAKGISVVGDFNNWDGTNYPMRKIGKSGIWNIFISGIEEWEIYKYEILTADNRVIYKSNLILLQS